MARSIHRYSYMVNVQKLIWIFNYNQCNYNILKTKSISPVKNLLSFIYNISIAKYNCIYLGQLYIGRDCHYSWPREAEDLRGITWFS